MDDYIEVNLEGEWRYNRVLAACHRFDITEPGKPMVPRMRVLESVAY